jgi:hypothetical protein
MSLSSKWKCLDGELREEGEAKGRMRFDQPERQHSG